MNVVSFACAVLAWATFFYSFTGWWQQKQKTPFLALPVRAHGKNQEVANDDEDVESNVEESEPVS